MEQIKELFKQFEQIQEVLNEGETYCILSKKLWLNLLKDEANQENPKLDNLQNINYDLYRDDQFNVIQVFPGYRKQNLNAFMKEKIQKDKHYLYIESILWEQIKIVFEEALPVQFKFHEGQLQKQSIVLRFLPIYQSAEDLIEGCQQFPLDWSAQETTKQLEKTILNQLLFQVPNENFIKLYIFQEEPESFLQLVELHKKKKLEVIELVQDIGSLKPLQYLVADIKLLNKGFYFEQEKNELHVEQFLPELVEGSIQGLSIFENQQTLTSCLLKCYECIDCIRTNLFKDSNSCLQSLLTESWYGTSDFIIYNGIPLEYIKEINITITQNRYDFIYVNGQSKKVLLNQTLLKDLLNGLLPDQEHFFECSNEYYTEKVNLDRPSNELKPEYFYHLSEFKKQEESIEVTVISCTSSESGSLKTYKHFGNIRKCYVGRQDRFNDLHLAIANLFEETDFHNYKEHIVNKKYELIFQTDQTINENCSYCDAKFCNNCIVPFIDRVLHLKPNNIIIYAVHTEEKQLLQREQPIIVEEYNLEDFVDFEKLTDEYLILNIDQTRISPFKLCYQEVNYHYKLHGVIEKIGENQYQCFCLLSGDWVRFNNYGYEKVKLENKLDAIRLFYCKF